MTALTQIRLELARSKEFPEGSNRHGYEMLAPLDADGKLDAAAWKSVRERCRVHRFWGAGDEDVGHLVHRPGGSWAFHYDVSGDEDDEAGYRLGSHSFNLGDYVSVRDEDGVLHTFRVVRAERA
jgi:hypothetical protein